MRLGTALTLQPLTLLPGFQKRRGNIQLCGVRSLLFSSCLWLGHFLGRGLESHDGTTQTGHGARFPSHALPQAAHLTEATLFP